MNGFDQQINAGCQILSLLQGMQYQREHFSVKKQEDASAFLSIHSRGTRFLHFVHVLKPSELPVIKLFLEHGKSPLIA
jgi:hypothetical protein